VERLAAVRAARRPASVPVVTDLPEHFRALVADKHGDDVRRSLTELSPADLPDGEVTIRVGWSSVNYKDALAVSPKGRVAKSYPLVPGIDLAGEVIAGDGGVSAGDQVIVHGYDLGVAHHGGYAEVARVPADWVVPLPDGLSARDAMALGTAGFTAALSVVRLEAHGLSPDSARGPVLVLGASGGVGSVAVGILAARGYEVHAATGKADQAEFLRALGAREVLGREETSGDPQGPLEKQRWAGVVDPVGGAATAFALRTTRYGGAVATSGLTGGTDLQTTIFPFILRAVSLLGVDSVQTPMEERREVWNRLAGDLRPDGLEDRITREVALDEVDALLDEVLAGRARGRTVVRVGG
jgi:acrylyl-CoA reductase (NADPH)